MATYNCKDVIVSFNGSTALLEKGFSDDGDFIVITPPTEIADVVQDRTGKYFAVSKNNNAIGTIKFSLLQGSPANIELQNELRKFRALTDQPVSVVVEVKSENVKWVLSDGAFVSNPEHTYSTKINVREWTLKGHLQDIPTLGVNDSVTDVTQGITDIEGTLLAGISGVEDTLTSLTNAGEAISDLFT